MFHETILSTNYNTPNVAQNLGATENQMSDRSGVVVVNDF